MADNEVLPNEAQGDQLNPGDIDPNTLSLSERANAPMLVPRKKGDKPEAPEPSKGMSAEEWMKAYQAKEQPPESAAPKTSAPPASPASTPVGPNASADEWMKSFQAKESPPEGPPPPPPPPPPSTWDKVKSAAGNAWDSWSGAVGKGEAAVQEADESAGAALRQPLSSQDGPFTRFAKNYIQSRDAASQQMSEAGNTDFQGDQLDPRNVAEFAAKASLALLNEGWSATGIPAAITTLLSQPTKELLDRGAIALSGTNLLPEERPGQSPFAVTKQDVTRAVDPLADTVDQVFQNIAPVGPHAVKEHYEPSSVQADIAKQQPIAPPGTLAERRAFNVKEQPTTMMEHAQAAAAETVKAQGGDNLSQVVAATHVNAELGAHYDAGAYEGHIATRHAQVEEESEAESAQAAEQARHEAFQQFQESEAGKAAEGKTPDEIWAEKEAADAKTAKQKDADYTAAKNQLGDEQIQRGDTLAAGIEKGGGEEPGPTIADALPPDTLAALQSLKERRAAEAPESTSPAETAARIKDTTPPGEDFTPLPPGAKGEEPPPTPLAAKRAESIRDQKGNGRPIEVVGPVQEAPSKPLTPDEQADVEAAKAKIAAQAPASLADKRMQAAGIPADRRADTATRKKVSEMSPEEKDRALLINDKSDIPNSRAYAESEKKPVQVSVDLNSLKWVNDNQGHTAGDVMIRKTGQALHEATGGNAYHTGGDEFVVQADTHEQAEAQIAKAKAKLAEDNIGISHGVGKTLDEADANMNAEKVRQEAAGLRAKRGEAPPDIRGKISAPDTSLPARRLEAIKAAAQKRSSAKPMKVTPEMKAESPEPVKGATEIAGEPVAVTHRAGDTRNGGRTLEADYGEFTGHPGADGDNVDVLVGNHPSDTHYIVDHLDENGDFEQHKVLSNFPNKIAAMRAYRAQYPDNPMPHVSEVNSTQLKGWLNGPERMRDGAYDVAGSARASDAAQGKRGGIKGRTRFRGTPADYVDADTQRAKPLTKLEAQRTLSPFLDQVGRDKVQVHQDASTLPDSVKEAAKNGNYDRIRGVYDSNGVVHIVAGGHTSHERLLQTAIHEIVGHKGLDHLFGDQWLPKMTDLYRGITNRKWLDDYASRHNVDLRTARGRAKAADEYAAHLAENMYENPSLWQKLKDSVRGALRKLGVVRDWTDDDIRALLMKARSKLVEENSAVREAYAAKGIRFAAEDDDAPKVPDDHPLAVGHKLGKTMEDQANYNPGFIRSRLDYLEQKGIAQPDNGLQFIGLRNLKDLNTADRMPDVEKFIRTHDQMTGRRGQIMEDRAATTRDWSRWATKNKEQAKDLGELMHSSTLAGVDPSKPFKERWPGSQDLTQQAADRMRRAYYDKAKDVYNGLDDKGKEIYNKVRDDYSQHRQQVFDALEQRINQSAASDETKKALMSALRQKFEAGRVQAPYFPLQRFGDHWAAAKDKDGNTVSFSRFESTGQKKAWIAEMKEAGYDVRGGERMDPKSMMEQINPDFVKTVTKLAQEADPSGELADNIWQEYLKAMPEMSMRKHFIHRQGRLGYSMDAMRAYSYNSFHGSHQLARLEYGNRLDNHIQNIKNQAQALNDADPASADARWGNAIAREMQRRYDWIKNPRASSWASAITKFGFGWYLGAAPATAFRIFSQNPMIASPILAAYHGQLGATRELSRASARWAMSRGDLGDTLRGDERKAFDTAKNMGVFSSTATQDLADSASGGNITGANAKVMKVLGGMFNAMEHHNRQTTYLAAYRLGRQQGMDHDTAVEHATDRTWDSHFDYANANRPRVLQNDFAKVAFLFKQYSWGITYRLARDARDMFNNDPSMTDADRSIARKTFAGMLSRVALWGGMTGLPMYWVAQGAINAMLGDENQPYDMEAALHHHLEQSMGKWAADSIMTGAVGATTGASLSTGASYNDLWYRPPKTDESASGWWSDLTGQFLGAIPQIGQQFAQGSQMIHDGHVERGFEHFLPPAISGLAKAIRYKKEGVTNLSGEQILKPEELDNRDLFLQAMGFTPQKVADRYAQNTTIKNISKAVMDRKTFLTNQLEQASAMDDEKEIASIMEKIEKFNETNPGVAIGGKGLVSSFRNHFRNAAEAVNGVKLPPGLGSLRDTYGGNPGEDEQ